MVGSACSFAFKPRVFLEMVRVPLYVLQEMIRLTKLPTIPLHLSIFFRTYKNDNTVNVPKYAFILDRKDIDQ